MKIKYRHTCIVTEDWKKLSGFYQNVFGCIPVDLEIDLKGEWFDKLTDLEDAHAAGERLLLPGHSMDGPYLDIVSYDDMVVNEVNKINSQIGYAHLCFEVDDVEATYEVLKAEGGSANGKVVTQYYPELDKTAHLVYAKDPDGNSVEILAWSDFKDRYPNDSCVYRHTNINAVDWQKIVDFYSVVFGCSPVFPTRDIKGQWFADVTGVKNAALKGQHTELPGFAKPPTFEIFTYENAYQDKAKAINETGVAHVCFEVDDVQLMLAKALAAGGSPVGETIKETFEDDGRSIEMVYFKDPEENIIGLLNITSGGN